MLWLLRSEHRGWRIGVNLSTINCGESKRLLDAYTAAMAAFHRAQIPLLRRSFQDDIAFLEARENKEAAFQVLLNSRRAYWQHVREHACRAIVASDSASEKT